MSRLGQWSSRVFSVELDGIYPPVYFALQEKHQKEAQQVFSIVQKNERCYSILVNSNDRIKRAKFYGGLKDRLLQELPSECEILAMSSFLPNVKNSLLKGYFLKDVSESSSPTECVLSDLIQNEPVVVCSYIRGGDGQLWSQHLWSHSDGGRMGAFEKYYVVPSDAPEHHPSTLNIINWDVFYSFEEAYKVLQEVWTVTCSICSHFQHSCHQCLMKWTNRGFCNINGTMAHSCGGERNNTGMHLWNLFILWLDSNDVSRRELCMYDVCMCVLLCACVWMFKCTYCLWHSSPMGSKHQQSDSSSVSGLQCDDIIPESKAVLEMVDQRQTCSQKPHFPVIIIEGLDATG